MLLNTISAYFEKKNDSLVLSYKVLRRYIGVFGILLPLINIGGGYFVTSIPVQESISSYYYTNMRDFFTGLLFVVSLFLISYRGYNFLDKSITTITGICGLGIALFPCNSELYKAQKVGIFQLFPGTSDHVHLTFASLFFILLAVNSIFLFTRTNVKAVTVQKKIRNIIYVASGVTIGICLAGILAGFLLLSEIQLFKSKLILVLESIALLAFGISWLVKGQTLFEDKQHN